MAAKVALDMVGGNGGREDVQEEEERRGKKGERWKRWMESGRRKKWIAEESKIDAEAETNQRAAIR